MEKYQPLLMDGLQLQCEFKQTELHCDDIVLLYVLEEQMHMLKHFAVVVETGPSSGTLRFASKDHVLEAIQVLCQTLDQIFQEVCLAHACGAKHIRPSAKNPWLQGAVPFSEFQILQKPNVQSSIQVWSIDLFQRKIVYRLKHVRPQLCAMLRRILILWLPCVAIWNVETRRYTGEFPPLVDLELRAKHLIVSYNPFHLQMLNWNALQSANWKDPARFVRFLVYAETHPREEQKEPYLLVSSKDVMFRPLEEHKHEVPTIVQQRAMLCALDTKRHQELFLCLHAVKQNYKNSNSAVFSNVTTVGYRYLPSFRERKTTTQCSIEECDRIVQSCPRSVFAKMSPTQWKVSNPDACDLCMNCETEIEQYLEILENVEEYPIEFHLTSKGGISCEQLFPMSCIVFGNLLNLVQKSCLL